MSDTEAKEVLQLKNQTPFQRFQRILGRGLAVGLESNVSKDEIAKHQLGDDYDIKLGPKTKIIQIGADEYSAREFENISVDLEQQNAHVRHSAATNGTDLFSKLLLNPDSAETLRIVFKALPLEIPTMFQRLNIRQRADNKVLGLAFARFPTEVSREDSVFYTIKDLCATDGYLNLDCLSRSSVWNPLFVKYHLAVAPSLKANEFGYVKIDINRDENRDIVVTVSRVQESEVPDILKTAQTLPR